jgi:c-di-GMP phosphodiesterase
MGAVAEPLVVTVRQAVCDRARALVGYEILAFDPSGGGVRATARALLEAFTADLDLVAPHHPAYITLAPDVLRDLDILPVAPHRVVLQVDAGIVAEPEALTALQRLAKMGYVLAARDPAGRFLLDAAGVFGIARLTVAGMTPDQAAMRVAALAGAGADVHAIGVTDIETFEACAAAGAVAFQGPFRELPRLEGGPTGEIGALASAVELMGADEDFDELEALIARDLGLSYKLLRYVNSAFFARRREVGTVREAMALLGARMTRRWAAVVAMAGSGAGRPDGLLVDALLRGRMLEELAADMPGLDRDRAFTTGLFSMLDVLVDRPMWEALDGLGLPAEVEAALLAVEPPYGPLLARVRAHLAGTVDGGAASERLDAAYRAALAWLEPLLPEVGGAARGE